MSKWLWSEWLPYAKQALEGDAWLVTGLHASRLLELVDAEIARDKPKTLCGCEGSCPRCRIGEVDNHHCGSCGAHFCPKCHGVLSQPRVIPIEMMYVVPVEMPPCACKKVMGFHLDQIRANAHSLRMGFETLMEHFDIQGTGVGTLGLTVIEESLAMADVIESMGTAKKDIE